MIAFVFFIPFLRGGGEGVARRGAKGGAREVRYLGRFPVSLTRFHGLFTDIYL